MSTISDLRPYNAQLVGGCWYVIGPNTNLRVDSFPIASQWAAELNGAYQLGAAETLLANTPFALPAK